MASFESTCTKAELLHAIAMFERVVRSEPKSKVAESQGISTAVLSTRTAVVYRHVLLRMEADQRNEWERQLRTPNYKASYPSHLSAWEYAIDIFRKEVEGLAEANPIRQLKYLARGGLVSMPISTQNGP